MTQPKYYQLLRKRGVTLTLEILKEVDPITQNEFFEILTKKKSYPNIFFRVKQDLLDNNLISYELDDNNKKVMVLTKNGNQILDKLQDIESLLK